MLARQWTEKTSCRKADGGLIFFQSPEGNVAKDLSCAVGGEYPRGGASVFLDEEFLEGLNIRPLAPQRKIPEKNSIRRRRYPLTMRKREERLEFCFQRSDSRLKGCGGSQSRRRGRI
jgi:hypothetical protein